MKLPESAALKLFEKHGLPHPRYYIVRAADRRRELPSKFVSTLVLKANIPAGGKKKVGLVETADVSEFAEVAKSLFAKSTDSFPFDSILVEQFIDHEKEFFLSLRSVREGIEIQFSQFGGIEVEKNWNTVQNILVPTEVILVGQSVNPESLRRLIGKLWARQNNTSDILTEFTLKLIQFFQLEDATHLEINPLTITKDLKAIPLGIVLDVDEAAAFRHPDWKDLSFKSQDLRNEREKRVAEVDEQIRGSVKLVEVPSTSSQRSAVSGQLTAVMGGGGATMFVCDAVLAQGYKLANYAEFSGNPPNFAVEELTKAVCAIPGVKNLVVGSGIANFTPVMGNFLGMIEGFKKSPQAKKLNIVIRRCGPGETEAIEMMRNFAKKSGLNIQVFGREIAMTEVVNKLRS